MNVNANSRFAEVPQVKSYRSKFEMPHSVKTSFNVGDLIPFYYEEVLPGDTFSIETNMIARMQPLVTPIMDDIFLDTYYFYVPNRIVWEHWKEFMGEATQNPWYPSTEYNIPHVKFEGSNLNDFGTIADYFGYPVDAIYTASQLPFRAYCEIWNEWFRDENLQSPVLVDKGDSDVVFDGQSTYGGRLLKANKYHDYFTSALPDSQRGAEVFLPINGLAPVVPDVIHSLPAIAGTGKIRPVIMSHDSSGHPSSQQGDNFLGTNSEGYLTDINQQWPSTTPVARTAPSNLWADISGLAPTMNAFRMALATQSFYEKNARGGSRYRELITSHFGVTSPDGRQQVPELLNYNRINININQVVQNSSSTEDSPLGRQAAYALCADSDNSFTKSFTEHGMVIGLCVARYKHTYQQGLDKRFSRRTMFDYYFPVFANLGEQPILNKEIFCATDPNRVVNNDKVFGYQEAFAEYRYHPDIVTSEMRSNHPSSLDVWHLADFYSSQPYLSSTWIEEDASNVDRVLAVTSDVSNQLFADFYIKNTAVRVMPMFSIPGLPRTL